MYSCSFSTITLFFYFLIHYFLCFFIIQINFIYLLFFSYCSYLNYKEGKDQYYEQDLQEAILEYLQWWLIDDSQLLFSQIIIMFQSPFNQFHNHGFFARRFPMTYSVNDYIFIVNYPLFFPILIILGSFFLLKKIIFTKKYEKVRNFFFSVWIFFIYYVMAQKEFYQKAWFIRIPNNGYFDLNLG